MVKHFGVAQNEHDISKYSGYLATVFSISQVLCTVHWGRSAERFGRKPVVITGMIGTGLAMLLLGFAPNYWVALLARALMGAVNGNVAIVRTMLGETCDGVRRHEALAFIVMPLMSQVGSVIGPSLGGSLTTHSPLRFEWLNKLNESRPFALVNIVVASVLFFNAGLSFLFVQETHFKTKNKYDFGLAIGDRLLGLFGIHTPRPWNPKLPENTPLLESSDTESMATEEMTYSPLSRRQSENLIRTQSNKFNDSLQLVPWSLILTPNLINVAVLWFFQNIQDVVFLEFLPIFLSTDLILDRNGHLASHFPFHLVGGLGFTSAQTGRLLSTTGILGIVVILAVFPYVDRNFNTRRILTIFLLLVPVCFLLLPYVVFLAPQADSRIQDYRWCFIAIYALAFIKTSCSSNIKPHLSLISHRGAPKEYKAVVNSFVVTISSLSRALGPLIWGYIFSFSQKHEIAWFSWWSLFVFSLAGFIQSFFIDTYDEEDDNDN